MAKKLWHEQKNIICIYVSLQYAAIAFYNEGSNYIIENLEWGNISIYVKEITGARAEKLWKSWEIFQYINTSLWLKKTFDLIWIALKFIRILTSSNKTFIFIDLKLLKLRDFINFFQLGHSKKILAHVTFGQCMMIIFHSTKMAKSGHLGKVMVMDNWTCMKKA